MADREQNTELKTVADLLDEIENETLYRALLTVDRRAYHSSSTPFSADIKSSAKNYEGDMQVYYDGDTGTFHAVVRMVGE